MDLQPTFAKLYPEGTHGGQCATFAHKLVTYPPVGDYTLQKQAAVRKYGILATKLNGDFRPGDVLVCKAGTHGHVAVINAIVGTSLRLTESNWHLDERVHHTRLLSKTSPTIYGVIRGPLKVKVNMKTKLINIHGEEGIFLAAANQEELALLCQWFGKDPKTIDITV